MSIPVNEARTATVTAVVSSATNVTLFAGDKRAVGVSIVNASTQLLYVKLGATASTASFTKRMAADEYWEVPSQYNGRIDGIWASANGNAIVTVVY